MAVENVSGEISDPKQDPDGAASKMTRTSSKHRLSDEEDSEIAPKKRQRTIGAGTVAQLEQETQQTNLAVNSSSLAKTSTRPYPRSNPHPSQDLVSLYNLDKLAASVARKDPVTGEKINVLRKTYKGKIKDFPGKNDPITNAGQFFDMLLYPDEEWGIQHVQGKELESALRADELSFATDFVSRLDSALDMAPGPLPRVEREKWRAIIDLEGTLPRPLLGEAQPAATPSVPQAKSAAEEMRRPKRKGTTRGYGDDAFEGYAEGFGDDIDELSIDTDGDLRGGALGKRRRHRVSSGKPNPHFSNVKSPRSN